jgi:hypothetical protein
MDRSAADSAPQKHTSLHDFVDNPSELINNFSYIMIQILDRKGDGSAIKEES